MVHVHRMLQSHPLLTSVCGLLGNNPIDSLPQLCEWYNTDKAGHVSPSGCSNEPLLLFAVGYILSNWCHCWLPFSWLLLFSERVDDFNPVVILCRRLFVFANGLSEVTTCYPGVNPSSPFLYAMLPSFF